MKSAFLQFILLAVILGGLACVNNGNADSKNEGKLDSASTESKRVENDAADSNQAEADAKNMTEESARKLASKHLALKKRSWGKAKSVSEREGKYYIGYETPERERRLLGQRVLIVDKDSGVVSYMKRR